MTLEEAIGVRCSRRKYLPTPIDPAVTASLQKLIAEYTQEPGIRIELVLNNGDAFQGLRKSYGMFSGVRHYIGLIADKNNPTAAERLGYYGERLVLAATSMGLGTCWVAGSFDRSSCPFMLTEGEVVICTITIGNTEQRLSAKEKLIYSVTHRKTKRADEMFESDTPVPDWFLSGMEAVQKAPSAVNRQPVTFSYKEGKGTAWVKNIEDTSLALDFGIAKLHFELGAGGGQWGWGNHAEFCPQQS